MVLFVVSVALAVPTVQVTGTCPGTLEIAMSGGQPNGRLALFTADATGSAVIPAGHTCSGSPLGLEASSLRFRRALRTDANGAVRIQPTLPITACGARIEVVDPTTCATSGPVELSGPVDCSFVADPSLSIGELGALEGTTAAHNHWRERVGVPRLYWDTALAQSAQAYADTCPTAYDPYRSPDAGFAYVGENLAIAAIPSFTGPDAVDLWAAERLDYDYGTGVGASSAVTGHYTQVVWESTEAIGCGFTECLGWKTVVCRYGEGGNYWGQAPYSWADGECLDLDNDDVLQRDDLDDTDRTVW